MKIDLRLAIVIGSIITIVILIVTQNLYIDYLRAEKEKPPYTGLVYDKSAWIYQCMDGYRYRLGNNDTTDIITVRQMCKDNGHNVLPK